MKKMIFAALMAVFTLCSVAAMTGGPTCRVRGNENTIASIDNTSVKMVYSNGIEVNVTLSTPAAEKTYVVVEIYDGNTCLGSEQIEVLKGERKGAVLYYNNQMEYGKVYTVILSDAYCM